MNKVYNYIHYFLVIQKKSQMHMRSLKQEEIQCLNTSMKKKSNNMHELKLNGLAIYKNKL